MLFKLPGLFRYCFSVMLLSSRFERMGSENGHGMATPGSFQAIPLQSLDDVQRFCLYCTSHVSDSVAKPCAKPTGTSNWVLLSAVSSMLKALPNVGEPRRRSNATSRIKASSAAD